MSRVPDRGVFDRGWSLPPEVDVAPDGAIWTVAPPPSTFVDRLDLLDTIRELVEADRSEPAIVAVNGLSGIGKSATLRRCAAVLRDSFDIALTVDFGPLRHDGAVAMADVLAELLADLRVDQRWIPTDLAGRHRRYLAVTQGCRILLLLDGVSDAAQVLTLLPNSPHALVLVAGEVALDDLVSDGALPHRLTGLEAEHGAELLAKICPGDGRVRAAPEQVRRLVKTVGGSPKAIRLLAARLRSRRSLSVAQLVAEIEKELAGGTTATRRQVVSDELTELFDPVYNWLPADAARLYRLVGNLPGRRWTGRVLAAAYDASVDEVEPLIGTLVEASLLDRFDAGAGSDVEEYVMLDLVRSHAQRAGTADEPTAELDAGALRAMSAALDEAVAADFAVVRDRFRVGAPEVPAGVRTFGSPGEAMAWFARRHDDLLAIARRAAAQGANALVWRLFQAMWPFYSSHGLLQAWREIGDLAVAAARADGDAAAEARALCQRSRACLEAGDFAAAGDDIDRAIELSRADGGALFASVLDFAGQYRFGQGNFDAALANFEASLAINERLEDQRGIALQSQFRGRCLGRLGRGGEALIDFDRARRLIDPFDDARTASRIAYSRAEALVALGDDEQAVSSLHEAIELARRLGETMLFAKPLEQLADIAGRLGNREDERLYVEKVVALHRQTGSPELDRWERRLAMLGEDPDAE